MRRLSALVAALLAVDLVTLPARADDSADALIGRGVELRRERRDAEALEAFQRAYAIDHGAHALTQVGLADQALGLWVEAEAALGEALATGDADPWVAKHRAQLADVLRELQSHLADIEVTATPPAAAIWINGARAQPMPGTNRYRVVSGHVLVEARADGFVTERVTLTVPPGARVAQPFALAAEAPSAAPTAPSSLPAVVPAPSPGNVAWPESTGGWRRTVAWSALAAAGASLVVGVAGQVKREQTINEYNDDGACGRNGVPRAVQCAGVLDDYGRFTSIMIGGYIGAVASAGVAAVLALTARADTPRARVGFGAGRDGVTISVGRDLW
jgi:hypothetical protein